MINEEFQLKYLAAFIILIVLIWQISSLTYFSPDKKSNDLPEVTTNFNPTPKKNTIPFLQAIKQTSDLEHSSLESVEEIENKLIELYSASQEELGASLSTLSFYKNQLELALARNDHRINRTLLMEPTTRIAMASYLEITPQEFNDDDLTVSKMPIEIQKKIINYSKTNDFKLLLLQGKITKIMLESEIN